MSSYPRARFSEGTRPRCVRDWFRVVPRGQRRKTPARISRGTSSSTPTLTAKHGEGQMRSRRTVEDPAQVYSRQLNYTTIRHDGFRPTTVIRSFPPFWISPNMHLFLFDRTESYRLGLSGWSPLFIDHLMTRCVFCAGLRYRCSRAGRDGNGSFLLRSHVFFAGSAAMASHVWDAHAAS